MGCSSLAQWASCIHVSPKAIFFHCLSVFVSQKVCLLKVMLNFFSRIQLKRFFSYIPFNNPGSSLSLCRRESVSVIQSCLTLCDPMDCGSPGSSVHGISQARILEWVVILFSRGSFQTKDRTPVSCIGRRILHYWVTREAHRREN